MTSQRKLRSLALPPTQPGFAVRRPKAAASRRRRKGNGQTELSRSELEQMLLQAAHSPPGKARAGSR